MEDALVLGTSARDGRAGSSPANRTKSVKYTRESLVEVVGECTTLRQVLYRFNLRATGGNYVAMWQRIRRFKIDTSHFLGAAVNRGKTSPRKRRPSEIMVLRANGSRKEDAIRLRRALVESGVPERCNICLIGPEWNGIPLRLQVDHQNGNPLDNRQENIRFLCPNCHSQTHNFGAKNIKR